MTKMPTGDAHSAFVCRQLSIPADSRFLAAVNGALLALTEPDYWIQHGTVTEEEAARLAQDMFDTYIESSC